MSQLRVVPIVSNDDWKDLPDVYDACRAGAEAMVGILNRPCVDINSAAGGRIQAEIEKLEHSSEKVMGAMKEAYANEMRRDDLGSSMPQELYICFECIVGALSRADEYDALAKMLDEARTRFKSF